MACCNKLDCYFGHCPSSWFSVKNTQRFGDWICLHHQVKVGGGPTLAGSLDRANVHH
jgi:hypothetical protein